jgi:hypothetical protein
MTILEDLEAKLADALGQVNKVTTELNDFSKIKQSLQSTDEGVRGAAGKLEDLSTSLEKGALALERAAASLSETNGIISKTDPAEIVKALTAITSLHEKLGKSLKDTLHLDKEELSGEIGGIPDEVRGILDGGLSQAEECIEEAMRNETHKLATLATESSEKTKLLVALAMVNTALLAFLLFRLLT